jgi:hypothetical protein
MTLVAEKVGLDPVVEWLESVEGETWSRFNHKTAGAGHCLIDEYNSYLRPVKYGRYVEAREAEDKDGYIRDGGAYTQVSWDGYYVWRFARQFSYGKFLYPDEDWIR